MPEISETADINYCASVLAKAVKLENGTAFAGLHDELGKILDTKQLTKVEDLARKYSDLPIHVLNGKISWLQTVVKLPLNLTDFLNVNVGNITNVETVRSGGDGAGNSESSQMNIPPPSGVDDPQSMRKKKNKKGKVKQMESEDAGDNLLEEMEVKAEDGGEEMENKGKELEKKTDETTAIEEPADTSSSTKRKKKKKKKKKSKNGNKPTEIEPEKEEMKAEQPTEWKKEEETVVLALDSGIGSCVASGGEDKSSVLSGGTVESNSENTEAATPSFNFEYSGDNTVNDFLQSEKVFIEHTEENATSNGESNTKNSNRFEISFGIRFKDDLKQDKAPAVVNRKNKKSKNKKSGAKSDVRKISKPQKTEIKDKCDFEISFVTPIKPSDEAVSVAPQQSPEIRLPKPEPEKFDSNSTFDYENAVLFLWSEWNRTIKE